MALTSSKKNRIWQTGVVLAIVLLAILAFVLTHCLIKSRFGITPSQRQEARLRDEISGLYVTIRQLEDRRGRLLGQLVEEQITLTSQTSNSISLSSFGNINGLVYRLIKNEGLANLNTFSTTNIAGVEQFVDFWGYPYDIELLPGAETNHGDIRIRVKISSLVPNLNSTRQPGSESKHRGQSEIIDK